MKLIGLVVGVIAFLLYYFLDDRIHSSDIQALEDEIIHELYGDDMRSAWKGIHVRSLSGEMENWMTHFLEPTIRVEEKPDVLLLHGYGATSAFTWRVTIPDLLKKFNVYAIDMPGFGRTEAANSLLKTDLQDTHDTYCNFYKSAIKEIGIRKPFVIAHSFGGFVFTQCAAQNPSMLTKLILVSVPGIFPSNGGLDFLWSNYFYLGLPQNILKVLGDFSHYLYDLAVFLTDSKLEYHVIRYWHLYHTNDNAMLSDFMVRKYIKHYMYYSIGKATSLVPLLKLGASVPVITVYGTHDVIVPYKQGEVIQKISFNKIRTHVIKGAHHVTYVHNSGHEFSQIVDQFFNDNEEQGDLCKGRGSELINPLSRVATCLEQYDQEWNSFPCVPSYFLSNRLQQQMYNAIYDIVERKCGLSGKFL